MSRQEPNLMFKDKEKLGLAALRRELAATDPIEARIFAAMNARVDAERGHSSDNGGELLTRSWRVTPWSTRARRWCDC
jgi:hypothetical protein